MLPFENMVADYVKETGNHVLYRVTPVFIENNLLASGGLIEAESVEDHGEGILFNVYCYNVQPGVVIDYTDGSNWLDENEEREDTGDYVNGGGVTDAVDNTASGISSADNTQMVWDPVHGGTKYHSNASCSGMEDPVQETYGINPDTETGDAEVLTIPDSEAL